MFNTKFKIFQNGTCQLTYYSEPIMTGDDRKRKKKRFTEGLNTSGMWIGNPFENDRFMFLKSFDINKRAAQFAKEKELNEQEDLLKKELSQKTSMNRSKKAIIDYGRSNVWEWFFTFTFKPVDGFDRENYTECQKKVSEWFKNIRKNYCKDIKYLIVPEQHESGAWHFHALVANCSELTFVKAVNNQEYRKDKKTGELMRDKKGHLIPNKYYGQYLRVKYPSGRFIYNIKQYQSGFITATEVQDTRKAVSYIIKYITKDLSAITFGKRRYLPSNNLNKPLVYNGLIPKEYINDMLCKIEYTLKVKLSIRAFKSYVVDVPGYYNAITVFEFNPKEEGGGADDKYISYAGNNKFFIGKGEEDARELFAYI